MEARLPWPGGSGRRAVSNVIGIVLIVAIVVVLAGVTAAYLTSFGEELDEEAPRLVGTETEFNATAGGNGHYLNVTHVRGDTIDTSEIQFSVQDAQAVHRTTGASHPASYDGNVIETQAGDELVADETLVLDQRAFTFDDGTALDSDSDYYLDLHDAIVLITWTPKGSDQSDILYRCEPEEPNCLQT